MKEVKSGCLYDVKDVVASEPVEGTEVRKNSKVELAVNIEEDVLVPFLLGLSPSEANTALSQLGLSANHLFDNKVEWPHHLCCETGPTEVTVDNQISRSVPEAGDNMLLPGKPKGSRNL